VTKARRLAHEGLSLHRAGHKRVLYTQRRLPRLLQSTQTPLRDRSGRKSATIWRPATPLSRTVVGLIFGESTKPAFARSSSDGCPWPLRASRCQRLSTGIEGIRELGAHDGEISTVGKILFRLRSASHALHPYL